MKCKEKYLVLLALVVSAGTAMYAQCTPDPSCKDDDGKPGQFCPLDLPDGVINVEYDETVTVIPPASFPVEGFGEVDIVYILIDSVENLPPGIDYYPNEDTLEAGTSYCIQLKGIPTEVGTDTLDLYITAMVDVLGGVLVPVEDDTSLVIQIRESLSTEPRQETEFKVYQNVPNPFSEITRLDYYLPYSDKVELNVYNLQGVLVHRESEKVPPGEHSFSFDGSRLPPGTYIYRVSSSQTTVSGRLVKSK